MKQLSNENELIFIKNPSDLYYFSGMNNPDAYILFVGKDKYYFTDDRYMENAERCLRDYTVKNIAEFNGELKKTLTATAKLGIEDDLPFFFCNELQALGVKEFYNVSQRIAILRSKKTEKEIASIRKAQAITDKVFAYILGQIKEGMTETELACVLESALYANGSDGLAFRSIVAFDENTSIPHAERGERKVKNGSIITLDFGAKYDNYCSDMTRTFFFGKADEERKATYRLVLETQEKAIAAARLDMTAKDLDTVARNLFAEHGKADKFLHSLGHGVGIDIHEFPGVSKRSNAIFTENMLVTVEPGLYFAGKYGIRIEDMIIFDKTGVINLTKSPKNIIIV